MNMKLQVMCRLVFGVIVLFFLNSCEEVGPDICLKNCGPQNVLQDTTYIEAQVEAPDVKKVLLEDFTGVRCTNCPQGHSLAKNLETQHPGQIVAVACHSDFLASPYSGFPDLRSTAANELSAIFSPPAKPSALIDRKLFPGETGKSYLLGKWNGYVNTQLQETPPVNLDLSVSYDSASREAIVRMELHYTQALSGSNRFGLFLMEDSINSAQLNGQTIDSPYWHMHVLREYLTPVNGIAINESLVPGRVIIKEFLVNISNAWREEKLTVGLFVSEGGTSTTVLQATKAKIK